jgi:hypothetical protein
MADFFYVWLCGSPVSEQDKKIYNDATVKVNPHNFYFDS